MPERRGIFSLATPSGGAGFEPRKGDEVLVQGLAWSFDARASSLLEMRVRAPGAGSGRIRVLSSKSVPLVRMEGKGATRFRITGARRILMGPTLYLVAMLDNCNSLYSCLPVSAGLG